MSGMLEKYLDLNSGNECALHYHRWSFIACTAACLGRRVWLPFGHEDLYPTMYVVLVGLPASRKSTAIKIASKLLKQGGYDTFAFNKTSREKFLLDLNEGFAGRTDTGEVDMAKALNTPVTNPNRECFIAADEFVDFLGMKNYNFLNLLTTLWDNLSNYPERLKNSVSVNIPNPTVTILGGFTPTSLSLAIPQEMIGQGFTSRLILVHAPRNTLRITLPKRMPEKAQNEFAEFFTKAQHLSGECKFSDAGYALVDQIYQKFIELPDARLQHYSSRRLVHLLKLCMVMCVIRGTMIISEDIVEEANTILTYTEAGMSNALGEFGEGKHSKATQKVMETLQNAQRPLTIQELWAAVSQDLDKAMVLHEIIQNLLNSKKIIQSTGAGETCLMINRNLNKQNMTGVNFERWIREYGGE